MKPRVAVLGSFVVGITVQLPRMPILGETLLAENSDLGPGGKGTNLAVGVRRLGGTVDLVVKIGDDRFGEIARELYRSEGIDPEHVIVSSQEKTGVGLVYLDGTTGENTIGLYPGANMSLRPGEVEAAFSEIETPDLFTAQLEIPVESVEAAFTVAKSKGVRTLLNPAPAAELPASLLALTDFLTPNRNEIFQLAGLRVPENPTTSDVEYQARVLLDQGPTAVIVTLGGEGVALFTRNEAPVQIEPFTATPVDTVGAGDAFNAGLAFALGKGVPLAEAARFGAACGALATRAVGVIGALPYADEVEALLSR